VGESWETEKDVRLQFFLRRIPAAPPQHRASSVSGRFHHRLIVEEGFGEVLPVVIGKTKEALTKLEAVEQMMRTPSE
jgi:hypothetical protein